MRTRVLLSACSQLARYGPAPVLQFAPTLQPTCIHRLLSVGSLDARLDCSTSGRLVVPGDSSRSYSTFFNPFGAAEAKKYTQRRLVGWSPEKLYCVVSEVQHYNKFVPWCQRSIIKKRSPDGTKLEAELEVGFQLLVERYVSHVVLQPPRLVRSTVKDSMVFHHLDSSWGMEPGPSPNSCWLTFHVDFAFNNALYGHLADVFFSEYVQCPPVLRLVADEVNALVLDLGSCLCKAGYAGDDGPKAVFPSSVGVVQATHDANGMEIDGLTASKRKLYVGQLGVNYKRNHMEVVSPWSTSDDGYADWDAVEGLCDHAIRERLRSDPKDFAIMMAEANATPKPSRDRLVELLFEKLRVPAIFLAKNAVLSAFATARQTAVIVDAGYRSTTVAAVHDGYALTKTFAKSPFGGQALNTLMQKVEALVSDIREALCKVNDVMFDEVANANLLTTSYELPDGTEIIVGSDRLKVPEVLFQPRLLSTFTLINPDTFTARTDGSVAAPLPGGLRDRLEKELTEQGPSGARFKVTMAANPTERRFSTWLGGSILASLGSFQQMWVSRKEYDEHGTVIVHRKAP
ncbi:hypothetical protein QJQ45_012818 [Haematococcus lacustris]|nr:hypothetical protein QJQ45_012818 [Haematococcus lacustris]